MNGKNVNTLVLIENGQIFTYALDDKNSWEVGRPSKDNIPDIKLHSLTVSRRHGRFQNMDGVWFYTDHRGKNGTIYNHKHLSSGLGGRIKPVMLKDGDTFVFGCGEKEAINSKTVWALFVTKSLDEKWRVVDSKGYKSLYYTSGDEKIELYDPQKGLVIETKTGIAIYMGDLTYLMGDIEVVGN